MFRDEVRKAISSGFRDLYIFGTAGEGYAVTLTQFREIAGVFREETSGEGVRPMVGVIGMSTAQVVEKVGAAHDIGFRTFQIALPPWGVLTDDEYMTYFTDVCGSFPDSGSCTTTCRARRGCWSPRTTSVCRTPSRTSSRPSSRGRPRRSAPGW